MPSHLDFSQPSPQVTHLLAIYNNNKMSMAFQVLKRQSDKYGTVRIMK